MEWRSTKENPIVMRPMANIKKLVNKLPDKIKKAKQEIQKLKDERV